MSTYNLPLQGFEVQASGLPRGGPGQHSPSLPDFHLLPAPSPLLYTVTFIVYMNGI